MKEGKEDERERKWEGYALFIPFDNMLRSTDSRVQITNSNGIQRSVEAGITHNRPRSSFKFTDFTFYQ